MIHMATKEVGLTQDSGWQVGVRKTLPIALKDAWDFLLSDNIVRLWLGAAQDVRFEQGAEFNLKDGTHIRITVVRPGSHLRLQFQPIDYSQPAIIQVRLIASGQSTVFAFHQERLPDWEARQARKYDFQQALDDFQAILDACL